MNRPILLATDGTPVTAGAVRVARSLQERDGNPVEVVAAVRPFPVLDTGFLATVPETEIYQSRQEGLSRAVRSLLADVVGPDRGWPVEVHVGIPSAIVARRAADLDAGLVLVGPGRHGAMERLLTGDTTLQIMRLAGCPVLTVPQDADRLPRTAVVGADFTHFSARALADVLTLVGSPATIHLVHVIAGLEFVPAVPDEWWHQYQQDVESRLFAASEGVRLPPSIEVHRHVREGSPARELLSVAEEVRADVVAVGSHGHSFLDRLVMGSVSTGVVRAATVAVIESPPGPAPEPEPETRQSASRPEWVRLLGDFTDRNAGRRTVLEMDHPELGAQQSGRDLPLRGVDYDPRSGRIEIMLGKEGSVDGHLTHSLTGAVAVEVLEDADGRDDALRVGLERGQVLLRILRD